MSETAAAQPLVSVSVARDGVALIHLNRPPANSYNRAFLDDLNAAVDRVRWDGDIGGAVLVSDLAPRFFSAGADISNFKNSTQQQRVMTVLHAQEILLKIERTPKIVVAAIGGHALGGGFEIALACDLIVASREARFGLPETTRGLVAGAGGLLRLPQRIPPAIAMEYALTGAHFTAEDAHRWGLVNRLTEPGDALAGALELARAITANGPLAVRATKEIVASAPDWAADERWRRQAEIMRPVMNSADAREGATAFAEKREPVWRGE
jgi:enoyl-CoA hydratase